MVLSLPLTLASALRSCCSGSTLEVVVIVALAGHLVESELSVRISLGEKGSATTPPHPTLQPHTTKRGRRGDPVVARLSSATEKEPKPRAEILIQQFNIKHHQDRGSGGGKRKRSSRGWGKRQARADDIRTFSLQHQWSLRSRRRRQ